MQLPTFGTDQSGLEQVNLCATVHLALHELELCDLAFGLSVRPWQSNCGSHRCLLFLNAIAERGDEALASLFDPRREPGCRLRADIGTEFGDDLPGFDKPGNTGFNSGGHDGARGRMVPIIEKQVPQRLAIISFTRGNVAGSSERGSHLTETGLTG